MSLSDSLFDLKNKMEEYIHNGSTLGWLIDRIHKHVYVYRSDSTVELKKGKSIQLSGEEILKDFVLDVWF